MTYRSDRCNARAASHRLAVFPALRLSQSRLRFPLSCWAIATAVYAACKSAACLGLTINITDSLPVGLWRTFAGNVPIIRGVVVIAVPPENPGEALLKLWGYSRFPLLKPIAAVPGDVVDVTQAGIAVNGRSLLNSAQLEQDGEGHRMPKVSYGRYPVEAGTVWLVSSYNGLSVDSRYFGPVPIANLSAHAMPIWIHPGGANDPG